MNKISVQVTEKLDLDVPRPPHQLLQIDLVLAKGGLRLAFGGPDRVDQSVLALDRAHAATAAAPGCLEHHGIADFQRHALDLLVVVG
jgi:hypothetical protein